MLDFSNFDPVTFTYSWSINDIMIDIKIVNVFFASTRLYNIEM